MPDMCVRSVNMVWILKVCSQCITGGRDFPIALTIDLYLSKQLC